MSVITIPYKPRPIQKTIHRNLETHRFNVLVAHRRLGKSVLGVNHLVKGALLNTHIQPRYFYMAPFLKQAKLIAWDYLKRYTRPIPGVKVNESELFVQLPNEARIWLFGADNPEAGRGTYWDGGVMDEYALIKPEVYTEIIRPALADRNGGCLFMGTPKGQNHFCDQYNTAMRMMAKGDPNWWAGLYRADETNAINAEELKQLRDVLPESVYRQEFLCDWTAASDNVLITIDTVIDAASKIYTERDIEHAPKIIGVDVARFGDDRTVIFKRQGLQVFLPKVLKKKDNMTIVGHVAEEIKEFKPDAVFIDAGRGEGVIDRLRQLNYIVQEVNFGGKAIKESQYHDKRSEMWDMMAEWLNQGGAIPDDPDLKSDLVTPTYEFDPSSRIRLESKDKIKERLGRSPDLADALALTFAHPVKKKSSIHVEKQTAKDYDPFQHFGKPEIPKREYTPF